MELRLKTSAWRTIGAMVLAAGLSLNPASAATNGAISVAQQNALVQKYCAVCHTDAHMNGGLSLEHFDAAHPDSGVAAMMRSKLKSGAMGAAGVPVPDKPTQDALFSALSAEAAGASEWSVRQTQNPATQAPILTASIVRETPSAASAGEPDLYRLKLTCGADTHKAEMQLTWAPGVPHSGQVMGAAVDGKTPISYTIDGSEKMGNGADGTSGPGAVVLHATPLPAQTLTIRNLVPDETVVFPFGGLTQSVRETLSTCFNGTSASR